MSTSTRGGANVELGPDANRSAGDHLADLIEEDLPTVTTEELEQRWDELVDSGQKPTDFRPRQLDLPGFGEAYDGSEDRIPCGAEIPHVCKDCGDRIDMGRTCYRSRCPRCAPAWVTQRAPGIVNRIMSAAKMKEGAQYKHHVAVSPPPDLLVDIEEASDDTAEDAIISMLQNFMREIGMDGIVVYHPWSGDNEKSFEENHDDIGEWKKRLFSDRDWHGDVREELQHRPHFHIIGTCPWFPGGDVTKRIHERTGWVFHRITKKNGSPVSLGNYKSVARAVTYALSHTGIDTEGDRNRYVHGKVGSAYHNADDRNLPKSTEAVHEVAPETLGIPSFQIECKNDLPEEEADHDEADALEASESEESSSEETSSRVTCGGGVENIDKADFVEDEDWQQTALHADRAVEAREEWKDAGGWKGWVGQAVLVDDDPPPD